MCTHLYHCHAIIMVAFLISTSKQLSEFHFHELHEKRTGAIDGVFLRIIVNVFCIPDVT